MASARYITSSGPQAEYEPGSHGRVLRNRLGIRRAGEMAEAEYEKFSIKRIQQQDRLEGDFDKTLKQLTDGKRKRKR